MALMNGNPKPAHKNQLLGVLVLMLLVLAILFWRSFSPDYVHFSNDGPLGQLNSGWVQMPAGITGMWDDMNYVGSNAGVWAPSLLLFLHVVLSPVIFAKFYPPLALLILSLGAWTCFRQMKLSVLAATLGALATVLNSSYFSSACWGVASQEIAVGMVFFALAFIVGCTPETPRSIVAARLALAGLCVGLNVTEGADLGALFSLLTALFVFFHALVSSSGSVLQKVIRGFARTAVVAVFAGFIGLQTVMSLVGTSIQGVAGAAQDTETKAQHWDWATQWSLPKKETLGLAVPGLFGYKMDTPKDMAWFPEAYHNGAYWGAAGRAPELDRYFDSGSNGPQPSGPGLFMRFTGGGNYCGILVLLVVGWAIAQSWRRQNSIFSDSQKRIVQFWTVVMLVCLLFAWGRFAPFYWFLYQLPYFSTIRNPAKFLMFLNWGLVIVFAFGVHALNRYYLDRSAVKPANFTLQLSNWWAKVSNFDRKWTYASIGLFGASALGWLIYAAQKPAMIAYLQKVGFPDADPAHENSAPALFAFSLGEAAWSLILFAIALGLLLVVISGYFNGPRAKIGALLFGGFLLFDMGRANLPWLVYWDYKQKYEVGTLNPVVEFLRNKPYEHRVAGLPFRPPPGLELFDELYRIEWMQHHFPYYNVQSLDLVQMPRMPEDMKDFKEALASRGDLATAPLLTREWLLTNTRYLLGPAGFIDVMNEQLDPGKHRFRLVQRFEVVPKPGITQPTRLEELTAVPNENGNYALFEFTGALPRAKLYGNWRVETNDAAILKTLADLNFDPAQTVFVSGSNNLPTTAANENSGGVDFVSYSTKHIVLNATNPTPAVLLLNDKYDSSWSVTVDGQLAQLLRCNFLVRGVYLPKPGTHTVVFDFTLSNKPIYVTLSAIGVGILLCAFLFFTRRPASQQK